MFRVELMQSSAIRDVLPPVCVISGAREAVEFHEVLVPMRRGGTVRLTLPFTPRAYKRWHAARLLYLMAVGVAVFYFPAGMVMARFNGPLGLLLYLAGCLLPIATRRVMYRAAGPEIERFRRGALVLRVPSEAAARAFQPRIDEVECMLATMQKPNPGKPGKTP